jgi:hypothetical protein
MTTKGLLIVLIVAIILSAAHSAPLTEEIFWCSAEMVGFIYFEFTDYLQDSF